MNFGISIAQSARLVNSRYVKSCGFATDFERKIKKMLDNLSLARYNVYT